jgi:hypothetical protein
MVAAVRAFITFLIIIVLIAGGAAIYLAATTPSEPATVRYPLSASDRAILTSVPASAETFAYVPRAAALENKVRRNAVARQLLESWTAERQLPRPWMLGNADLLIWQSGKRTRYLLRLDPVRATIVRVYLMASGDSGDTILINAPSEQTIAAAEIAGLETLAAGLPPGDALVVQRAHARGGFPPIGRPSVSSVAISDSDIVSTSRAASTETQSGDLKATFARSAMLNAAFTSPPRIVGDLNRLLGGRVSDLFNDGGSLAVYDVDSRKLLPRPLGVFVLPPNEDRRKTVKELESVGARVVDRPEELVVSFDDSIGLYIKDGTDPLSVAGGRWAVRIDPQRLAPVLEQLKDHVGLRIASPRMFRAVRSLRGWIGTLREAKTIDATDSVDGQLEELKVRISTK